LHAHSRAVSPSALPLRVTRLIVLDKWREDPQAQERFGAVVTYDLDLTRGSAVPLLRFSKPLQAPAGRTQGAAA